MAQGNPSIPSAAWRRRFDETHPTWPGSPVRLRPSMLLTMFPVLARAAWNMLRDKLRGSETTVWTHGTKAYPTMGVPLGGLGGGTITRGWRGHFVRWQLRPGVYRWQTVAADQFSLWVRREGEGRGTGPEALVLSPRPQMNRRSLAAAGLDSWSWDLDETRATYHALFPRAWTVYEEPVPGVRLTCRQISPVIPHNYKESSYPAAVFLWTIENAGPTGADAALMFTFQNGTGGRNDLAGGHVNRPFRERTGDGQEGHGEDGEGAEVVGVALRHVHRQRLAGGRTVFEDPLTFAVGALAGPQTDVTRRTRFILAGRGARKAADAADLWRDFVEDGRLEDSPPEGGASPCPSPPSPPPSADSSSPGEAIAAAVAARVWVPAGESRDLVFVLAWDMPVARFGSGTGWYRRYTRFLGRDGEAAPALAREAAVGYRRWEEEIEAWQRPVLDDPSLPEWYKSLLFNETYYLTDGGTLWTAGRVESGGPAGRPFLPEPPIGHFGYLEGHEYRMYNTYDVHFSASFALAMLWPELELGLQRDFASAVLLEHPETVRFLSSGVRAPRKRRGVVPHDLGTPAEDPWRLLNAYNVQDVGRWKDLNPKFVLQVCRDYRLTGDAAFLADAWPAVEVAVTYMLRFDRDGDGLIENEGFPDQTYDVWTAKGPSAYSGCLWLACLEAGAAIAEALTEGLAAAAPDGPACRARARAAEWRSLLARARQAYEARLWNGEVYLYDAAGGRHSDSVMADQLAGQWFARACGLPDVVPPDHYRKVLRRVFDLNVRGWTGTGRGRPGDRGKPGRLPAPPRLLGRPGERGAVNGLRPDGRFDRTCLQSTEVWMGTTLSLAAAMLQEGLIEETFATAKGVYLSVYRDFPLWFQTPEAIDVDGVYRAIGYMRPLAVWSVQWELERAHLQYPG